MKKHDQSEINEGGKIGLLKQVSSIISQNFTKNTPVIKALLVLDKLGIDARIWYVFEQSNFDARAIITEIIRIARIHTKIDENILLNVLTAIFAEIEFSVSVYGSDMSSGVRDVINLSSYGSYAIEFYALEPISCSPLKLSAIISRGNFKNQYNVSMILYVKAIAFLRNNTQLIRLIRIDLD